MSIYNLYIDESCHLQNDYSKSIMAIGYIKCAVDFDKEAKRLIKAIKVKHRNLSEVKWSKVSVSHLAFYKELVDFFFANPIEFRCVLIKYKERLDHEQYNQGSHDNFYYKIIYLLLNNTYTNPANGNQYRAYLDIKDTRGREKIAKIKEVFANKYSGVSPFIHFQHIRSHESEILQIADLFTGAITYKARNLYKSENSNTAKNDLIDYIELKSGYTLDESTEPWETKFNIFDHQPKKRNA